MAFYEIVLLSVVEAGKVISKTTTGMVCTNV